MHGRGGGWGKGDSKDVQVEVCRRGLQILTLLKKKFISFLNWLPCLRQETFQFMTLVRFNLHKGVD